MALGHQSKGVFLALLCTVISWCSNAQTSSIFSKEQFSKLRFAHRGGYGPNNPENTLNTILGSLRAGQNAIEIDVQFTKDNQLILFHDYTLERLLETDEVKKVESYTYSDFLLYPLRNKADGEQYVPLLEDLVDSLVEIVPQLKMKYFLLELDFKPHGEQTTKAVNELVRIIEKHHSVLGDQLYEHFFISTFYPDVLKYINQIRIEKELPITTAFAVNNSPDNNKIAANLAVFLSPIIVKKHNATILEPNICMISPKYVRRWQNRGMLINAYTANKACEKDYIQQYNVAYTTNCPGSICDPDPSDQIGKPKKWCKCWCKNYPNNNRKKWKIKD